MKNERKQKLVDLGAEKLTELLYRKFRCHRSTERLQELLAVIGDDKQDHVVTEEVAESTASGQNMR